MRNVILAAAAGFLLASAGAASASPGRTTTDLNLRTGPGTGYAIIDTMPAGARVDIRDCSGSWCRIDFHGTVGWASANLLAGAPATYVYERAPTVIETAPAYVYGPPYWGPDVYGPAFAYEPGFSIGFGFGGGGWHHRHWRHGGWHGGHHHRH